jgi:Secretion system C-terminal sorting domain
MTRSILFIAAILCIIGVQAQSKFSGTVISTGGGFATGSSGYTLSYTIGEMSAIQTFSKTNVILTQGFQQPVDQITGILETERTADGSFSIYPNPVQGTLWYGFEFSDRGDVSVSVYDMAGKLIETPLTESYDNGKVIHRMDCSAYAAAMYIMTATFTPSSGKTVTITKKLNVIN